MGKAELRTAEGNLITLSTKKVLLLLAMVALAEGQEIPRSKLAQLIWPDSDLKAARDSLRSALASLKAALPPGSIEATFERIKLQPGWLSCDALEPVNDGAYPGDFLPDNDNDWVIDQRLRLRAEYTQFLTSKAKAQWESGNHEAALATAEQGCTIDGLDPDLAALRVNYLKELGRMPRAVLVADAFRGKVLKELGVISDLRPDSASPPASTPPASHPMLAAAEWLLDRNPDEALAFLASTESQWLSMATEKSLTLHWRTLAASKQTGPKRTAVEARHAYLLSLSGKLAPYLARTEETYKEALAVCDASTCFRLAAALSYGYLSKGEFDQALRYARAAREDAFKRNEPFIMAEAELLLSIIEVHTGHIEEGNRRCAEAYARIQICGDAIANASYGIVRARSLLEKGRLEDAAQLIQSARRVVESNQLERVRAWVLHSEAALSEAAGDNLMARAKAIEIKEIGPEVAGHSVIALADDLLTTIDCQLREFDTAAEAFARATAFRKHLGTVASRFERTKIDPSIRLLQDRLGVEKLQAIYRQARAV
jgi:DNA-binding SARP family transcriptional activator